MNFREEYMVKSINNKKGIQMVKSNEQENLMKKVIQRQMKKISESSKNTGFNVQKQSILNAVEKGL